MVNNYTESSPLVTGVAKSRHSGWRRIVLRSVSAASRLSRFPNTAVRITAATATVTGTSASTTPTLHGSSNTNERLLLSPSQITLETGAPPP
jgi:hypothetical protein